MRKRIWAWVLAGLAVLGLCGCGARQEAEAPETPDTRAFEATVLAVEEGYLLVQPKEGTPEAKSADRIQVPIPAEHSWPLPRAKDLVTVYYGGDIMESYPARLHTVFRVEILAEANEKAGQPEVYVTDIVDGAESGGIPTDEAVEPFWRDGEFEYSFPSIRSHLVQVQLSDGRTLPVKEALEAGVIAVADLDTFGIRYYAEPLSEIPGATRFVADVWVERQGNRETGNCDCADTLVAFYEDDEAIYYFSGFCAGDVVVMDNTGKTVDLASALAEGFATLETLDAYGIRYVIEMK